MKTSIKSMALGCCAAVIVFGGMGRIESAHAFIYEEHMTQGYMQQEQFIDEESNLQLYDEDEFGTYKGSYNLFEQSGERRLGAELKYFESDRLKLTHDYGGDVADGRVESFHTMLRLKLSF